MTTELVTTTDMKQIGRRAQAAARQLAVLSTAQKNAALQAIADMLRAETPAILDANAEDVAKAEANGLSPALVDRLLLTHERIENIAREVEHVIALPDPVGECFDARVLPNGLPLHRRRTPLGVVGVIYESRPNVTVDVATLCLKTGNAVILRGGSETINSNAALGAVLTEALQSADLPADAIQVITDPDRALVLDLLRMDEYVAMIIPRGGAGLHRFCRENATVPVITGGLGVCHMYVERTANLTEAIPVIHNAKVQRPSTCNSLDTLLVQRDVAGDLLPRVVEDLAAAGVEIRAHTSAMPYMPANHPAVRPAAPDDFGTEFMALILSVRVVDGLDEVLDHIAQYGTDHSDAILTEDRAQADRFVAEVDSAAVFVNASTRFNDGGQLGLGAEVAVSTQKLHARGPMGLHELTTYKWIVGALNDDTEAHYFVRQ